MSKLVQKVTILDFVGDDGGVALFMAKIDEDSERPPLRLLLPVEVAAELREADPSGTITIAIRPGNAFSDHDIPFQTPPDTQ